MPTVIILDVFLAWTVTSVRIETSAHGSGQLDAFQSAHVLHAQTPPAHRRCVGVSQIALKSMSYWTRKVGALVGHSRL